MLTFST